MEKVEKERSFLSCSTFAFDKQGFKHYTLKEIFEQPDAIKKALTTDLTDLPKLKKALILGCGSSWNAGYIGKFFLEEIAGVEARVEISSEYRFSKIAPAPDSTIIAISQSGETADTIAAIRTLREKSNLPLICLCNEEQSTIARMSDFFLPINAGKEIGVGSTKTFINQLILFARLSIASTQGKKRERLLDALYKLPDQVSQILNRYKEIEQLAEKYAKYNHLFYLGRCQLYPTALEAALKVKEFAYVNANAYPAGELKHGPIALIDPNCPTVAFCGDSFTLNKMQSNLMEIKSRGGSTLCCIQQGDLKTASIADDCFEIPPIIDEFVSIPTTVFGQLFAYYVALKRGCHIDQPKNLAKSVTVE